MKKVLTAIVIAITPAVLFAEGLSIGSGYNLGSEFFMSVDGGVSVGDVDVYGVRINFPLGEKFLIFGDVGNVEIDGLDDDIALGGGVLTRLGTYQNINFGAKGSYHLMDVGGADVSELAARVVASGAVEPVDKLIWFAEAGIHFLEVDFGIASVDDTELGVELGLLYTLTEKIEIFGGFEMIDDSWVNFGLRYNL